MNEITQKLVDLLGPIDEKRTHFSALPTPKHIAGDYEWVEMSKVQKELTEKILQDHFNFKEIIWIKDPNLKLGGITYPVFSEKLNDGIDISYVGKTCYLYQILFTPEMYCPTTLHEPVKDGCVLTPMMYDPLSFQPKQSVTITWNKEEVQDLITLGSIRDEKQFLINKLGKVLENPEAYKPEGARGVVVRMVLV